MPKIDIYNVKTSISVFLCVLLFKFFHRSYPFYACIAAISCMRDTSCNCYSAGKSRIIGTCIGAAIGLIFFNFLKTTPLYCGIGIAIVIYLCNLFNKKSSIVISCIVFIAIMTNLKGMPSDIYAINRIIDTTIGVIIAVFVNKFFEAKYIKYIKNIKNNVSSLWS
ncbi:hypothetical protein CLLI_08200 [Clostridium liquoris]|uniref:Fusaric acid resistance protein family protein n=1 Tax=Clostridium liquoris TaxID=1289519 RepID=A0A2T0B627_9CLOT|nr:aromatic acid exporter family protein [Clostridium liquoris]PRR79340.1 hypothetical protein CLLI_08200 [Clostridium liquoris]